MTRRKIISYDPNLKELSRQLRRNSTLAEVLLWNHLKKRQMRGYQFLRQKPLDNYIVDFFCYELMLAIEIDGDSHDYREEKDLQRQQRLESFGITFLRFADIDVKGNMEGVLQSIKMRINELEEHPPTPPSRGE